MNIDRIALLAAINTVKPALATKDLVEELCMVWFDGQHAMAYNDAELGIQVPFKCPFTGGIRGELLLGLLSNSRAREITLDPDGDGKMKLKAARMKAELSVLNGSRSIWQFPEPNKKASFPIPEAFIAGLKAVLVSVGNDTSIPEKLGVTVQFHGGVTLYSTDSVSMAQVQLEMNTKAKAKSIILPTAFCEQLLRLCSKGGFIELRDDCAIAGNEDGVNIFARLVYSAKPLNFASIIEKHERWSKGAEMEVPDRLPLALERALVLLNGVPKAAVDFTIEEGHLTLETKADGRGHAKDVISIPDHVPDISVRLDPELIKRALPFAESMIFTNAALIMRAGDDFTYIAATTEK